MSGGGELTAKVINDRYSLTKRIGFGGMGAVYIAHDRTMDRTVAVKELRAEYSQDELLRKRFIREAQAAGGLSHPNIVTVHDLITVDNSLFIVMEFLDGGTLLDRMNAAPDRRMDVDEALRACMEGLQGLQAAHDEGLVHRDIKPGNVIFDTKGRAKIADFGVVTARKSEDTITTLTQVGTHPGTLVYMAPEQIDGAEVDGRSDVYSMAAVLYECLAGTRYFERQGVRRSERALMDAICEEAHVPLRSRVPYVPEAVERILDQALAKFVEDRPSAGEMATALRAILEAPRPKPQIVVPGVTPIPSDYAETRPSGAGRIPSSDTAAETRAATASGSGRVPQIHIGVGEAPTTTHTAGQRGVAGPGSAAGRSEQATEPRPRTEPIGAPPRSAQTTPARPGASRPAVSRAPTIERGRLIHRPQDGAEQVRISGGTFIQGSDASSDERPIRRVTVGPYLLDRHPVTVAQYRAFLDAIQADGAPDLPLLRSLYPNGKDHRPQGWGTREFDALCPSDDHPVVLVDWFDACVYAAWAGARLPTEAEWERAARGLLDARAYVWGDTHPTHRQAVFGRRTPGPEPVGSCPEGASAEGVLDLAGNVWEWCLDCYDPEAYDEPERDDPLIEVEDPQATAVKRGGSWTNSKVSLRCSRRGFEKLHVRRNNLGFRCVQAVES